jgi:hypothetical protein
VRYLWASEGELDTAKWEPSYEQRPRRPLEDDVAGLGAHGLGELPDQLGPLVVELMTDRPRDDDEDRPDSLGRVLSSVLPCGRR